MVFNKIASPKHKQAYYFFNKGLFANLSSFVELENRISGLPEMDRGNAFEVFAEAYFKTQNIDQVKEIWPEKQLPQNLRDQFGIQTDAGVDGVFLTHQGLYKAYQVKFRTNRTALTWDSDGLGKFFGQTDRVSERVLFTNSIDLSHVVKNRVDFYSIKGTELDKLDQSDFKTIEHWLESGSIIRKNKSPYPYQIQAISDLIQEFNINDRATAIMACGTGKTFVALWVAEKMEAQTILVLLPSLALVRQVLDDWSKANNWEAFNFLCVCSDATVIEDLDETILYRYDLNFPVTTQAEDVERYLLNRNISRKIIFSTYQSCHVVAQAMSEGFSFDLAIFDEAHKTASREAAHYAFALQDKNISVKKRLFLTATPRHYNINKKDKEGNQRLVFSMDDEEIYGRIAHQLSFRKAVSQKLICDYKIIISTIVTSTVTRESIKQAEVVVGGDVIKAQRIANILAIKSAVDKYGIKRIFSFHNSVQSAESFTTHTNEGVGADLEGFEALHVNGKMSTGRREGLLNKFKESDKAIISNARCLTEGVNVPAVDMVAFLSPKKSKIDIIQAAGRAMRNSEGKEFGYILVPLFVQMADNESVEQALEKTNFDTIWDILQAMQEQDENLVEIIGQMKEELGRALGYNDNRLREKFEVLGPVQYINVLREAITTNIVDKLGLSWDERFGELTKFKDAYGHCNVPNEYPENKPLGTWVEGQRSRRRRNNLEQSRVDKLDSIGFDWNPIDTLWEKQFGGLEQFKKIYGHCDVPSTYNKNKQLVHWIINQRAQYSKKILSQERVNKLINIGFNFDPNKAAWEKMFSVLCNYKVVKGHCNVPQNCLDNKSLGAWVSTQRARRKQNNLEQEQIDKLDSIGFIWNPNDALVIAWEEKFNELKKFKKNHGNCDVPGEYSENQSLASWVIAQRARYRRNSLEQERINKLDSIGFDWNPRDKTDFLWQQKFEELQNFKRSHGHCEVHNVDQGNQSLVRWMTKQRAYYRRNNIEPERVNKLNSIGFDWNPIDGKWDKTFLKLYKLYEINGHCNVSRDDSENSALASWIAFQRVQYKKKKLSQERVVRLEKIGIEWDPIDNAWEESFLELYKFKEKFEHCKVPKDYPENPSLGSWVDGQRQKKKNGILSENNVSRLNSIGFEWTPNDTRWEEAFSMLCTFKKETGHCNVPSTYNENKHLAHWVIRQRTTYSKKALSKEYIDRLINIGFVFEPDKEAWEKMFFILCNYKELKGDCDVPQNYVENPLLGRWVTTQRVCYNKKKLAQDRIDKLNNIGFTWKLRSGANKQQASWEEMFLQLCKYKNTHGDCDVSSSQDSTLAAWLTKQRAKKNKNELVTEHRNKLEKIGFAWDSKDTLWKNQYSQLLEFRAMYGHCNVPRGYAKNPSLGLWVSKQRSKKNKLPQEYIHQLEKLNFDWHPNDTGREKMFLALRTFKEKNGHCNVPKNYPENPSLGAWVDKQRNNKRNNKLALSFIDKLNAMGFDWDPVGTYSERMFAALKSFKDLHGHCNVPRRLSENYALATWVGNQRALYKEGKLFNQLNDIGFDWYPHNTSFEKMFPALEAFKNLYGHCKVPQKYPENPELGRWVSRQRVSYRAKTLSQDRIDMLNGVGFVWELL